MTAPARTLYTPAILAAATMLADYPWDEALALRGEARSRRCGSTLALGLGVDGAGRITSIGLRAHACAIGQASAHVFASAAAGRTRADIVKARAELAGWLAGETGERRRLRRCARHGACVGARLSRAPRCHRAGVGRRAGGAFVRIRR